MAIHSSLDYGAFRPLTLEDADTSLWQSMRNAFGAAWDMGPTQSIRDTAAIRGDQFFADAFSSTIADADVLNGLDDSPFTPPAPMPLEAQRRRTEEEGVGDMEIDPTDNEAGLELKIHRRKIARAREALAAHAPGWHAPFSLAASFAGGMVDPVNIASCFIPVVGQERMLSMLGQAATPLARAAIRARAGAASGAVGAAAVEPIVYAAQSELSDDYGMTQSLINVGAGAVLGAALGPVAGHVGEWWRQRRGYEQPWTYAPETDTSRGLMAAHADAIEMALGHTAMSPAERRASALDAARAYDQFARRASASSGQSIEDVYRGWRIEYQQGEPRLVDNRAPFEGADNFFGLMDDMWAANPADPWGGPDNFFARMDQELARPAAPDAGPDGPVLVDFDPARLGEDTLYMLEERSKTTNVAEFLEQIKVPDKDKKVLVYDYQRNIVRPETGDKPYSVILGQYEAFHIRRRHPTFARWEEIPDLIANGTAMRFPSGRRYKGKVYLFYIDEGDKVFATIAVANSSKEFNKSFRVLTAFEGEHDRMKAMMADRKAKLDEELAKKRMKRKRQVEEEKRPPTESPIQEIPQGRVSAPLRGGQAPHEGGDVPRSTGGRRDIANADGIVNREEDAASTARLHADPMHSQAKLLGKDGSSRQGDDAALPPQAESPIQEIPQDRSSAALRDAQAPNEVGDVPESFGGKGNIANADGTVNREGNAASAARPHADPMPSQARPFGKDGVSRQGDDAALPPDRATTGDTPPADGEGPGPQGGDGNIANADRAINGEEIAASHSGEPAALTHSQARPSGEDGSPLPGDDAALPPTEAPIQELPHDRSSAPLRAGQAPHEGGDVPQSNGGGGNVNNADGIVNEGGAAPDESPDILRHMGDGLPLAQAQFAEARAVVTFFRSANLDSAPHEVFHIIRRRLAEEAKGTPLARDYAALEERYGVREGRWTRDQEDAFADQMLRVLRREEMPAGALAPILNLARERLFEMYCDADSASLDISPAMREVFNGAMITSPEEGRRLFTSELADLATRRWEQAILNPELARRGPEPTAATLRADIAALAGDGERLLARPELAPFQEMARAARDGELAAIAREMEELPARRKMLEDLAVCYYHGG